MGKLLNIVSWPRLAALVPFALALLLFSGTLSVSLVAQEGKSKPKEEEEEPTINKKPPAKDKEGGKKEEEEEPAVKKKRVPIRVDDEPAAGPKPAKPAAAPLTVDLATAAREAKHPDVKRLYQELEVPHDIIVFNSGRVEFVRPLAALFGDEPKFSGRIVPLDQQNWKELKDYTIVGAAGIKSIEAYEKQALRKVDAFLKLGLENRPTSAFNYLSRQEMLQTAERVLAAVVRFHQSARERGDRKGAEWEAVEAQLRRQLLDAQYEQLDGLAKANDWPGAYALAVRLAEAYQTKGDVQTQLSRPLVQLAQAALRAGDPAEAQLRLRLIEDLFPQSKSTIGEVSDSLRAQARAHMDEARQLAKTNREQALARLKMAERIDPRLPGLQSFQLQLRNEYPVLRVGVRRLPHPERLSPARAFTDSEKLAVDLMFESLVKPSFDPVTGQRYEPGLARSLPRLIPLGRQFDLSRNASWSNGQPVTAADVSHTVRLLKEGRWAGRTPSWADDLFEEVQVGGDPFRVNLTLRQGYLDPLSLMTFKILPQEPGPDRGLNHADDATFARNPVGSGPFQYESGLQKDPETQRPYMKFVANPHYGNRSEKRGLPRIREVHLYQFEDPAVDLKKHKVDLVLNLYSQEVARIQEGTKGLEYPPPQPNRRVYFLAVNHRQKPLGDTGAGDREGPEALRRAIAHAIDREALLNEFFRAVKGEKVHRPLNGPYPAGSWACKPSLPPDPFNLSFAKVQQKKATEKGLTGITLTLKYPAGDPTVKSAMTALCTQLNTNLGITVTPLPVDAHILQRDVEQTQDYQLAYYHYDFPSEALWLWPLLDPRSMEQGGQNYMGYQDNKLEVLFREVVSHRDFSKVQTNTHVIHDHLYQTMPLIPLWQLDTLNVYHPDLKPTAFDPLFVFSEIELWRLQVQVAGR